MLEPRTLFSTPILGTPGDDTFIISVESDNHIQVNFNGGVAVLNPPSDGHVDVLGYGGNDTIWVQNTNTLFFYITGHDGDDFITLGNGQVELDIRRDVTVVEIGGPGQGGNDRLLINDVLSSGNGTTFAVRAGEMEILSSLSSPNIIYNLEAADQVSIQGSDSSDYIFVDGLRPNFTFNTGGGDDTVDFGGGADRMDYAVPSGVLFDAGNSGNDLLLLDDSNASSTLGTILVRDNEVLEGVGVRNFDRMTIRTHNLPGNVAERVLLTGRTCPAFLVAVIGSAGPDLVQIGSESKPLDFAPLYAEDIDLQLGSGVNSVEITEDPSDNGHTWSFDGSALESGSALTVRSTVFIDLTLRGTNNNDDFLINSIDSDWSVGIEGRGGNDTLRHAGNDIDAVFTGLGSVDFNGGAGTDVIQLNDSQDQTGDVDSYTIADFMVAKSDFDLPNVPFLIHSFVDQLFFTADSDPNVIRIPDLGGLALADIAGHGGDDTFTNVSQGASGTNMVNNLGGLAILRGGGGTNALQLDDRFGPAGNYDLTATQFTYDAGTPRPIQYNSMSSISIDGSNQNNQATIRSKPGSATLTVNGIGGDDTFTVGGGDIDSNGFTVSNTTVSGGDGTADSITFDDRFDDYAGAANENETYTLETLTFRKDNGGLNYFAFESQRVLTADVLNGNELIDNTINLNNNSTNITSTTIVGGSVRGNGVNVSNGNITLLSGDLAFHLGMSGGNAVFLKDQTLTQPTAYTVESNSIRRSVNFGAAKTIAYSGVNFMIFNAGTGGDTFSFNGTPAGMISYANGNGGDDTLSIGALGSIDASLLGRVESYGGPGADTFFVYNVLDATPTTSVFTSNTFAADAGVVHSFLEVENVIATLGGGANDVQVHSATVPTNIYGGNGNDTFTIGNGDVDANIAFDVTVSVSGGAGNDQIRLDDLDDATTGFDNQYFLQAVGGMDQLLRRPGSFGLQWIAASWSGIEAATLDASNLGTTIDVIGMLTPLRVNGNGGGDSIRVGDAAFPVTVNGGAGEDALYVNSDYDGGSDAPATVVIDGNEDLSLLEIKIGGTLRIASGAVVGLTSPPGPFGPLLLLAGTIDLAGGAFLVRGNTSGGSLATLRSRIVSGRNGGAWNGISASGAINSSLAASSPLNDGVGYGAGSQVPATLGSFTIGASDTLIRYTLNGDSDLDLDVDLSDLGSLASHFGSISERTWSQGNFDYDEDVDLADLGTLATTFGTSLPSQMHVAAAESLLSRRIRGLLK